MWKEFKKGFNEFAPISYLMVFFLLLMAIAAPFAFYDEIHGCAPCGYVNFRGDVEPGYEVHARTTWCMSCAALVEFADGDERYLSMAKKLHGCPRSFTDAYNEKAKRLNADLIAKGYKPKFEIVP